VLGGGVGVLRLGVSLLAGECDLRLVVSFLAGDFDRRRSATASCPGETSLELLRSRLFCFSGETLLRLGDGSRLC
jgi:hypothetical protein